MLQGKPGEASEVMYTYMLEDRANEEIEQMQRLIQASVNHYTLPCFYKHRFQNKASFPVSSSILHIYWEWEVSLII